MKKIYVFIAAIALLSVACRKETVTDDPLKETKTNCGSAHFWFSIGRKAYFGKSWRPTKYFYQYDFITNILTQKADFPHLRRVARPLLLLARKDI